MSHDIQLSVSFHCSSVTVVSLRYEFARKGQQADPGRSSDWAVLSLAPGSEGQTGFTCISLPPMLLFCWPLFRDSPANSHQGVNRVGERLEAAEYLGQAERDSYRSSGVLPGQIGPGKIR